MSEAQRYMPPAVSLGARRGHIVLVGAGNLGSHTAPALVNRTDIASLTIIDRDTIEARNCRNQAFAPHEVGRPKAEVLARRVAWIERHVEVTPIVADLVDVPLGVLAKANLILAGLDSLAARQVLHNDLACRIGISSIDGAVDGSGGTTGRVQVFVPGQACVECSWGDEHYRQLGREMPCTPEGAERGTPNLATAELGAAVARLMVDQARAMLRIVPEQSYAIDFDVNDGRQIVSRLRRAAGCRFDHQVISEHVEIERPFESATVADVLEMATAWATGQPLELGVRRGLFGSGRSPARVWCNPDAWRPYARQRLADFGLGRDDWIELRMRARRGFLRLDTAPPSSGGSRDACLASRSDP